MDASNGFTSVNPHPSIITPSSIPLEEAYLAPSPTTSGYDTATGSKRKRTPPVKFYSVQIGKNPGIYHTWAECLDQVRGHPKAKFKSFTSLTEAHAYLLDEDGGKGSSGGKPKFYGVREGRVPGVYTSWPEVLEQITGWKGPKHKVFKTRAEAELFVKGGGDVPPPPISMLMNGDTAADGEDTPKVKKIKTMGKKGIKDEFSSEAGEGEGGEYEPGEAPLLDGAEDGFDSAIILDPDTGKPRYKTAVELSRCKYQAVGPAPGAPIRIYTDGSTLSNGRVESIGGVGVYFGPKDSRNISEPLAGSRQTNQRAELTAILRALEVAPRDRRIVILSDSNYAINCVTVWFQKWRTTNWHNSANKPVENRDLVLKILDLLEERRRLNAHRSAYEDEVDEAEGEGGSAGFWERGPAGVTFTWVKGHAKDEGNNAADELAVNGARVARELGQDVDLDD